MGWHELITTRGRCLRNVEGSLERGQFKVYWARLDDQEEAAVLIDRLQNCAYISKPFDECQILAAIHGYELALPRRDGDSFRERIEWYLGLL